MGWYKATAESARAEMSVSMTIVQGCLHLMRGPVREEMYLPQRKSGGSLSSDPSPLIHWISILWYPRPMGKGCTPHYLWLSLCEASLHLTPLAPVLQARMPTRLPGQCSLPDPSQGPGREGAMEGQERAALVQHMGAWSWNKKMLLQHCPQ